MVFLGRMRAQPNVKTLPICTVNIRKTLTHIFTNSVKVRAKIRDRRRNFDRRIFRGTRAQPIEERPAPRPIWISPEALQIERERSEGSHNGETGTGSIFKTSKIAEAKSDRASRRRLARKMKNRRPKRFGQTVTHEAGFREPRQKMPAIIAENIRPACTKIIPRLIDAVSEFRDYERFALLGRRIVRRFI